jgi:hypothetical protein
VATLRRNRVARGADPCARVVRRAAVVRRREARGSRSRCPLCPRPAGPRRWRLHTQKRGGGRRSRGRLFRESAWVPPYYALRCRLGCGRTSILAACAAILLWTQALSAAVSRVAAGLIAARMATVAIRIRRAARRRVVVAIDPHAVVAPYPRPRRVFLHAGVCRDRDGQCRRVAGRRRRRRRAAPGTRSSPGSRITERGPQAVRQRPIAPVDQGGS